MDTLQIKRIMEKDKFLKGVFKGVFAANTLPKGVDSFPSLYVINTARDDSSGEHWCAAYFSKSGNAEFWDSFGNPPDIFQFSNFMDKNSRTVTYNSAQLQGNSSMTCGGFCVYFSLYRSRGVKMRDIISRFTKNKNVNDNMIREFMYKRYSIKL